MADEIKPQAPVAPTTTAQQDLVVAGQRRVNMIWESTQSAIAIIVTLATVYAAIVEIEATTLTNAFFLVVGFYYSRTNHTAIGGVGPKATQQYVGR
jgi:hypothetical protein